MNKIIPALCIALAFAACSSPSKVEEAEDVDLDNLSFCDCWSVRNDLKADINRATTPEQKESLEQELAVMNTSCKQYDPKEGLSEEEMAAFTLDRNVKVEECMQKGFR